MCVCVCVCVMVAMVTMTFHRDVYFKKIEATPQLSSTELLHLSNSYVYPLELMGAPDFLDVYINQVCIN